MLFKKLLSMYPPVKLNQYALYCQVICQNNYFLLLTIVYLHTFHLTFPPKTWNAFVYILYLYRNIDKAVRGAASRYWKRLDHGSVAASASMGLSHWHLAINADGSQPLSSPGISGVLHVSGILLASGGLVKQGWSEKVHP